ncbi:hypothetical protein BRADI_4g26373v3 [Brachypodium distachyon]|uniref:Uncharacterized protein n=1 Tax=Brachypodium distachyon TaxID=15368 RepID=A0A0Q3HN13_BRADI|nr:hypothetical protein BRADI_4g26373v3 [Brachypodium distachyon]KQJ89555.1 hypothetical protein BRADI_4g26373v3 [Brachypodium distachyon]
MSAYIFGTEAYTHTEVVTGDVRIFVYGYYFHVSIISVTYSVRLWIGRSGFFVRWDILSRWAEHPSWAGSW